MLHRKNRALQAFKKKQGDTIVFMGKTGVGKSSTINTLFKLNFKTDPAVACTKKPQVSVITIGGGRTCTIVDLPGFSESIAADARHFKFYKKWISKATVLVWITQADTRAYKQDELCLIKTKSFFTRKLNLIIGLNKIDSLEGENFELTGQPNASSNNIAVKKQDVHAIISQAVIDKIYLEQDKIVPYSALYHFGMENLREKILNQ